ncbi:LysR family transcriptional regulator [Lactobacillus sp. ESL0263]|uniref:LysR family transcriptional regulator n=1 Tax=Lactobacillus sp. ESL0263 TaxID=2069350 RepID=UPI000EFD6C5D|nr:LysR family transcriptional regulator [Lactobacillus sp. ESL0263]RMC50039.1 LysR family transcriptional regulator [Lactobacillus sp. ESL0263]
MKYSLLAYKYFIDVVETQGFTPAAKRNFVSQTAISNAIKNLEDELGVQLIDRSTSHFKVTVAGKNLYNCAVPVLKNYYEFNEKISQLNNSFQTLRIHYLHGFDYWTVKLAESLTKNNPSLKVQLDTENFSTSIPKLDAGDYDVLIGFSTAVSKIKNIHVRKVGTASFGILLNQNSFDSKGKLKKNVLKRHPLFLQRWGATDNNDVQTKIKNTLEKMHISYEETDYLDSFDSALSNVVLNHGMAIYPEELSLPKIYDSRVTFLPELPKLKYDVVAIYKNPAISNILERSLSKD